MPAWTMDDESMLAEAALQVVSSAKEHGLDPADYGEQEHHRVARAPDE